MCLYFSTFLEHWNTLQIRLRLRQMPLSASVLASDGKKVSSLSSGRALVLTSHGLIQGFSPLLLTRFDFLVMSSSTSLPTGPKLNISTHPLLLSKLTQLRLHDLPTKDFREGINGIGWVSPQLVDFLPDSLSR